MKIILACGKYQYGDRSRGLGTEYASFVPALKNLGHDVHHFELWDRSACRDYRELNLSLLRTVESLRPDILLAVPMNYEIWLETLDILRRKTGTATICWTTDDSWKYREVSRFIGGSYDVITTTYPDVISQYHHDGIRNVHLTQWAARQDMLQEPLPASECPYDVTFVGSAHGNRRERVKRLELNGLKIHCFGHGWPAGPVSADEIPRLYRESKISLNFNNTDDQWKKGSQIKARTFEVPGAGGFLLTETATGLENHYLSGQEVAVFRDDHDLTRQVRYYLSHPSERDAIARAGYERTRCEHTYELRFRNLLAVACKDNVSRSDVQGLETHLSKALEAHRSNGIITVMRAVLTKVGILIWGNEKGKRASRRLVFELSWRLSGRKTFTASGWPGRMFPDC